MISLVSQSQGDPETRYGAYKNYAVGKIKFLEPAGNSRQHVLIGSVEMTTLLDTFHRSTSNRWVYVPKEYALNRDMVGQWCLYGFYLWSNRVSDGAGNPLGEYKTILTLRHFELLPDEAEAMKFAFRIMESIKLIKL